VREGLFRSFANRKEVAAYAGLTPLPFALSPLFPPNRWAMPLSRCCPP
jgi:hypothetical protein